MHDLQTLIRLNHEACEAVKSKPRLALLVLPTHDNDGAPLNDIHAVLREDITDNFGGFTSSDTNGAWRAPDGRILREPSIAYHVAMDNTPLQRERFRSLARHAATLASQDCVFVAMPDGAVEYVKGYDARAVLTEYASAS